MPNANRNLGLQCERVPAFKSPLHLSFPGFTLSPSLLSLFKCLLLAHFFNLTHNNVANCSCLLANNSYSCKLSSCVSPLFFFQLTSSSLLMRVTIPLLRQARKIQRKPLKKRGGKSAQGRKRKCQQRLHEIARLFRCSCSSCSRCACKRFTSLADSSEPHSGTGFTSFNSSYFLSFRSLHFFCPSCSRLTCDGLFRIAETRAHTYTHKHTKLFIHCWNLQRIKECKGGENYTVCSVCALDTQQNCSDLLY